MTRPKYQADWTYMHLQFYLLYFYHRHQNDALVKLRGYLHQNRGVHTNILFTCTYYLPRFASENNWLVVSTILKIMLVAGHHQFSGNNQSMAASTTQLLLHLPNIQETGFSTSLDEDLSVIIGFTWP